MSGYLLIESRDPLASRDVDHTYELATRLAEAGHEVTLFLVQNGVLPVRSTSPQRGIEAVLGSAAEVLADEFSLRERGIATTALMHGVRPAPIEAIVERMCAGWKVSWQ